MALLPYDDRRYFHINDDLQPVASRVITEQHKVRLELRSSDAASTIPFIPPNMLRPKGDLVSRSSHSLPILSLLLVGDQSSQEKMLFKRMLTTMS